MLRVFLATCMTAILGSLAGDLVRCLRSILVSIGLGRCVLPTVSMLNIVRAGMVSVVRMTIVYWL